MLQRKLIALSGLFPGAFFARWIGFRIWQGEGAASSAMGTKIRKNSPMQYVAIDKYKIAFLCEFGAEVRLKIPSHCKSSFQRAGTTYVAFTSIVEFSAKVEFTPSIRSGGRRGTDDTVMLPPGGRAFNPVPISQRSSYNSRTVSTYQRDHHHHVASPSEIDG